MILSVYNWSIVSYQSISPVIATAYYDERRMIHI